MSESTSLSEARRAIYENPNLVVCSSLPLYVLAEKRPCVEDPDHIEVACTVVNGATGLVLYLSPLDAMIGCRERNSMGKKYEIFPFEAIDPRDFIRQHGGWLSMYIVFGFAAYDKKLLLDEMGRPSMLLYTIYEKIPPEQIEDHFHLEFSENMTNWLDRVHRMAGLPDYDNIISEQTRSPMAELDIIASSALQVADYLEEKQCGSLVQCAIYDPVEAEWRFVNDIENLDGVLA